MFFAGVGANCGALVRIGNRDTVPKSHICLVRCVSSFWDTISQKFIIAYKNPSSSTARCFTVHNKR